VRQRFGYERLDKHQVVQRLNALWRDPSRLAGALE
jgi:hypothetical protein